MRNLKEDAKHIFLATLQDIDIQNVVQSKVRVEDDTLIISDRAIDLSAYKEVVLIGFGKCSLPMGAAIEKMLGDRIKRGLLVSDRPHELNLKSEVIIAGHPLPDSNSLLAGQRILSMVESCGENSLIIFLVSGGGSALVEVPIAVHTTLEDLRKLNQILITCGASIREINIIRKHLSRIKGGRLGSLARRSQIVCLFISDVNSGDLRSIASNPLLPDDSTYEEFQSVLDDYQLAQKLPETIARSLRDQEVERLPKHWDAGGTGPVSALLLENSHALKAASKIASSIGYKVEIDLDHVEGNYRDVADALIAQLIDLCGRHQGEPVCLLSGGEVSCPVTGDGTGGRNQEFVLYSAARLSEISIELNIAVLSCGTDGIDGNSDAAGAVADRNTIAVAENSGISASHYILRNDSNTFFEKAGGLVVTGPTGNNVRDVRVLLAKN